MQNNKAFVIPLTGLVAIGVSSYSTVQIASIKILGV